MKNIRWIVPVCIFAAAFFLRIYRLPEFISYHQDQVRDLLIVWDHFKEGGLFLLGPKASVGNFYLPPFWYYLMAFAYLFSSSPVTPAFLVALISSSATVVIFLFGKRFFSYQTGIIASALYAISPLSIEYSRFSWNPNPIPFFVILVFYLLYLYIFENRVIGFYAGTIAANLAFQLHYQGFIIFVFFPLVILFFKKLNRRFLLVYLLINSLLILPFFAYEIRSGFPNIKGIVGFLTNSPVHPLRFFGVPFFLKFIYYDFSRFIGETLFFKNQILGRIGLIMMLIFVPLFFLRGAKNAVLAFFFFFSLFMLFFYRNSLISFYLLFLIPIVILFFVLLIQRVFPRIFPFFFLGLILMNLWYSPTFGKTDGTYVSIQRAVDRITQNKQNTYCLSYEIFPQTFIENKLRYLVSISSNQPNNVDCEKIVYYMNYRDVETAYYVCEAALCRRAKAISKIDFARAQKIKTKGYDPGVEIYEIKQ